MDQNDKELGTKKDLLKREILDKHFDQDSFINFCMRKKTNGDDMNNWSIEELNQIIIEFVVEESQANHKKLTEEEEKKNEEINRGIRQIQMTQTQVEDKPIKTVEINCRRMEKGPLNDKPIKVLIQNPRPVETGFLSSNYINYEVNTFELEWLVRRRYSDFEWLRTVLLKYHPGHVVPPLPSKKIGSRRFEVDFIEKRMKFLSKFMDSVLENEDFKASEPLNAFLSMTDRQQFECKMKELTTYQPSTYIEEFKTLTGTVTISEEEENEKYFSNIYNYFKLQTQLYDRLNYNLKNFYMNITTACEFLEDAQKDFETLHLLNSRVLMREGITKTYEELGVFFKAWKRILVHHNEVIKIHCKDFFKFIQMEGTSYDELITKREEVRYKFATENARLTEKKERLWKGMDTTKWEIIDEFQKIDRSLLVRDKLYAFQSMCTKETQNLDRLRKQLGYFNRMNMEQLKKMITSHCERFSQNNKFFSDEFYPTLTDGISIWTGFTTFASNS